AVDIAHRNIETKLREASSKWDKFEQQTVNDALDGKMRRTLSETNPQLAAQFGMLLTGEEMRQQITMTTRQLQFLMENFARAGKTDEAKLVASYIASLQQENVLRQRGGPEFYFGGSAKTESLLDFMIWLRQADQLGIQLTEKDIKTLIDRE